MFSFTHPAARAATVAATLLGTIVFASPLFAASGDLYQPASSPAVRMTLAQASAEAMTAPPASEAASKASSDRIEARIKELHQKLHVTAAQETQWSNLAQVMRDNAKAMSDLPESTGRRHPVDERRRFHQVLCFGDRCASSWNDEIHPGLHRSLRQYVGRAEEDRRLDVPQPRARRGEEREQSELVNRSRSDDGESL